MLDGSIEIKNPIGVREDIMNGLAHIVNDVWTWISGLLAVTVGFFMPIKDIVHLLILFFAIDVVIGYISARKVEGEKFSTRKIWNTTIPRMILSLTLIVLAFMWDKVYEVSFMSTHYIVGWFISGVLLSSIAKNMYRITKWDVFPYMSHWIGEKVNEKTGMNPNDVKDVDGINSPENKE